MYKSLSFTDIAQSPKTVLARVSDQSFVSGTANGIVQVWNVAGNDTTATTTYKNSRITAPVKLLQVLSDQTQEYKTNKVVIGYETGDIEILDITHKVPVSLYSMEGEPDLIALLPLRDSHFMAVYASGSITVWNLNLIHLGKKILTDRSEHALYENEKTLTKLAKIDNYLASGDVDGEIRVWKITEDYDQAGKKIHRFDNILTIPVGSEITGLELLIRSNLHVLGVSADGNMRHWKVTEENVGEFSATLDDTSDLGEGNKFALASLQNLSQWVIYNDGKVERWKLPMKILPQNKDKDNSSAESSVFSSLVKRAAKAVERPTTSVQGKHITFDEENSVQACILLSANLLIISAKDNRFYLGNLSRNYAASSIRAAHSQYTLSPSVPCVTITRGEDFIGEGGFGEVFKAKLKDQTPVAVKRFQGGQSKVIEEVSLHIQLSHSNIISLYGLLYERSQCSLVLELMGSALDKLLSESNSVSLPLQKRYQIAHDAAAGLKYLHDLNICHRDLKSENMLLNQAGRLKIIDFGLSAILQAGSSSVYGLCGTVAFLAPEVIKNHYSTKATDIYALIIVFWEIFTGKISYDGMDNCAIMDWVSSGKREKIPENMDPYCQELIEKGWSQNPEARPEVGTIYNELVGRMKLFDPSAARVTESDVKAKPGMPK